MFNSSDRLFFIPMNLAFSRYAQVVDERRAALLLPSSPLATMTADEVVDVVYIPFYALICDCFCSGYLRAF